MRPCSNPATTKRWTPGEGEVKEEKEPEKENEEVSGVVV